MWNSFRTAADLALTGILVTLGSVPVLTAGAALRTGGFAVSHLQAYGRWPTLDELTADFRRRVVPGLWIGPALLAGFAAVTLDVAALRTGRVPGGLPMLALTLLVAAAATGYAATAVLLVPSARTPAMVAAATGVVALTALLAVLVHPVLVPALTGFALYAVHATAARLTPTRNAPPPSA